MYARETWRVGAWDENKGLIAVDYKADNYSREEWLEVPEDEMFQRLWIQSSDEAERAGRVYDGDGQYHWEPGQSPCLWRPSLFMPKWAARFWRVITAVRAERLQNISEEDAIAEGVDRSEWKYSIAPYRNYQEQGVNVGFSTAIRSYCSLWDTLHAKPKPVRGKDHRISHYVSYPWEDVRDVRTYRGLNWYVSGNPWVWRLEIP